MVSFEESKLLLEGMVLLIQEVHLVRQFADGLLVGLVSVLHTQDLEVLASFIKLLETLDLLLPYQDLLLGMLQLVFHISLTFLKLLHLEPEAVAPLIGFGQLLQPFLILFSDAGGGLTMVEEDASFLTHSRDIVGIIHSVCQLELLLVPADLGHEVQFSPFQDITGEALNHLILRWQIHLGESFLQLRSHFSELAVQSMHLGVLGLNQETEVAHLVLELSISGLPLEVDLFAKLTCLYHIQVELIILAGQPLILFLKRHQCLLVQLIIGLADLEFIL